jgi:hypothetical protein
MLMMKARSVGSLPPLSLACSSVKMLLRVTRAIKCLSAGLSAAARERTKIDRHSRRISVQASASVTLRNRSMDGFAGNWKPLYLPRVQSGWTQGG